MLILPVKVVNDIMKSYITIIFPKWFVDFWTDKVLDEKLFLITTSMIVEAPRVALDIF